MSSPEAARRMALWAIELSEFDVRYRPRTSMKGQAVADFIAKYTQPGDEGAEGPKHGSSTRTGHQISTQEEPA